MSAPRIGVLGGSFDPPHCGHLALAAEARAVFALERVLLTPANVPPHKREQALTPAAARCGMLRLATADQPWLEVEEDELARGGVSYTIDTMRRLAAARPADYHLLAGVDAFLDFGAWKDYAELMRSCHILIATRPGCAEAEPWRRLETLFPAACPYIPESGGNHLAAFRRRDNGRRLVFFRITPVDAASREIRQRVAQGLPLKNMLPPQVENYIIEHRLYQS